MDVSEMFEMAIPEQKFRHLANGRVVSLMPLTYGRLRVTIGPDEVTYDDGYWYEDTDAAVAVFESWEGNREPDGWVRHLRSGRRRPGGDKSQEFINH